MTLTELMKIICQKNDWDYPSLYKLYMQNNFTDICNLSTKILNNNSEKDALNFLLYHDLLNLKFMDFFSKEETKTLLKLKSKIINCDFIEIHFNKERLENLNELKESFHECSFKNCTFAYSYEEAELIAYFQIQGTNFFNCALNSYSYKNDPTKIKEMWMKNKMLRKETSPNKQFFSTKTNVQIKISQYENVNYEQVEKNLYKSELIKYLWNFTIIIFNLNFKKEDFFEFLFFLKAQKFQTLLYLNEETFLPLKEIWMRMNVPIIIQQNTFIPKEEIIELFEKRPETILSRTILNSQSNKFHIESFLEFCKIMKAKNILLQSENEPNDDINKQFKIYRAYLEEKRLEWMNSQDKTRIFLNEPTNIISTSDYRFQIYPIISQKIFLKEALHPDFLEDDWLQSPKHSFDLHFNNQGDLFLDSLERKRIL